MKILIADDDPQFLKALRITLHSQGYGIVTARDGVECMRVAIAEHPDMLIVDLGMPNMDGMKVIEGIRGWTDVPILVVSGRVDTREKVRSLDAGADDYITKPVSIDELLARIRALSRRIGSKNADDDGAAVVRLGEVMIDLGAHSVTRRSANRESRVRLTPTEWKILEILARNHGRLVTRQDILTQIWGGERVTDSGYLRLYISQLRKKLETDPAHPNFLLTEPGMGYRLEVSEPPRDGGA
ncbi:MAG: response regulator transcription factor [Bifidobacterium mongoliense]|jgi:two-component system KDP operon response regulator KdpE|uniref:response regulator transcription factor n=1 Tax=Bifidobacterium mongoliense TaxID=518643 RepID=UPI002F358F34